MNEILSTSARFNEPFSLVGPPVTAHSTFLWRHGVTPQEIFGMGTFSFSSGLGTGAILFRDSL